ncbi:hypothetical protein E3N88_07535 [Mikania micrantha]|uniref:Uncharacterized protein n=1 Tax=Mikania micrantha TaxID=192012 RepID=A0A5N6PUQ0_9ASTR|nr:hypothetical protein E3N88_07535 [Mikania micrantha]
MQSLIQRVTPIFAARIRHNSRLLSAVSSSALAKDHQSISGQESVHLSDNCVRAYHGYYECYHSNSANPEITVAAEP